MPIHGILRRAKLLRRISVAEPAVDKSPACGYQRRPKRCAVLALVWVSPADRGGKIKVTDFTVRHFGLDSRRDQAAIDRARMASGA
ncbi:hypothetical protein EN859_023430 [Mesorhizobium sp. M00.F.Ca.ET.216.01.1.1]|nr:hypothetical protein EN859_023430 [Mesorhizobium sp. M00.F.Ca.ET.216.01.1.1]